jgi:hypothetical protein
MLQQTINHLLDHLQSHVPASRHYRKTELREGVPGLPAPLAHFLVQRIDQRIAGHIDELSSDDWLDTDAPGVQEELDRLEQTLGAAAHIPAGEWPDMVAQATRSVLTYLVDPVTELTEFIFRAGTTLPISEVQARMSFFSPYSYLHSVFSAYADRQNLQHIDRDRFEEVLRRIDRQMVADYGLEKWTRLFQPLYDIHAVPRDTNETPTVPVELLRRLAANKGFDALAQALHETEHSRVHRAHLRELIVSALDDPSATPPTDETDRPTPTSQESIAESGEPQPRWKKFQKGSPTNSTGSHLQRKTSPKPAADQKPGNENDQKGQPLWQRFQPSKTSQTEQPATPSAPNPSPPASNSPGKSTSHTVEQPSNALQTAERQVIGPIPEDQRERFVRHLFNGSERAYETVLTELQQVDSWEAASSLIANKVFLPYQVNIYSEPAVTFTDLVEARLRKKPSVQQ